MRHRVSLPGKSVLVLLALLVSLAPVAAGAARSRSRPSLKKKSARDLALEKQLLKATTKVQNSYLGQLEKIAVWAASKGLKKDGEAMVRDMERIDAEYAGLAKVKERIESAPQPPEKDEQATLQKSLVRRVKSARDSHARRLFTLAKQCMEFGLFTRSYLLIKDVIAANPDHSQARRILGYVKDYKTKTWITKWESTMRKKYFLTEEGWVKKSDRKKWEKGLRPYKGKWISKEEEARIRARNNYAPYTVDTEHFEVSSNLGRERAFEFAMRLESFYRVFFEFFVGFYDQVAGAKLLFNRPDTKTKHKVLLFPSRVKYLDFVRSEKGNDELLVRSGGFWSPADRSSFFYWTNSPAETTRVLYHETTHQLFGETKEQGGRSTGNIWVVEGIAHYMELWEQIDGKWHPGYRVDAPSMKAVQQFLAQNPGWNMAAYIALGHKEFHERTHRTMHYFLGGALSHFFLHFQGGIYRESYIQLLRGYYDGKLRKDSLPDYIQVEGVEGAQATLDALQKQFREYMKDLKRPDEAL